MSNDRFLTWRTWLTAAIEQAEKSWSEGGIPIGSVLVSRYGEIVARGHNERVQTGDPTAHAEMVAIRRAGRRRDFCELSLVSDSESMPECARAPRYSTASLPSSSGRTKRS